MLEHELPQQVIVLSAGLCKAAIAKAEVAESVHRCGNAQCIGRQLAFETVFAADGELCVKTGCHVEAPIAELMKLPVAARVLRCNSLGHGENRRLQFDDVTDAEKFIHEGHALGLGNDDVGD